MNLRTLIATLEEFPPETPVPFGFSNPHSYRGYYSELAFEPDYGVTVGSMLADARYALGSTYTGYKGGEFTMGEYTDCYLAPYGSTGSEISFAVLASMLGQTAEWWAGREFA